MSTFTRARTAAAAAALTVPILLTGCSSGTTESSNDAASVRISDQWIKAADSGMSSAFADFSNSSDREVRVVDATSPASARMEIHETVDTGGTTMMRPMAGGLVVPAHGTVSLTPGGNHLMFMDLKTPLRTGSRTPITVKFADGSSATFTAQARDFSGNQENYAPTTTPSHGG
ncbi:copper chaperone PCu(A)C [Nocardia sp. CA2R105]|uniref:copper chaperone PCu(A)C n=1 Tax=Nocardia coffeae TaxID=2873381 RepID=UPI001CA5FC29|nr:copper chaperone PCu(A)C [Nocardia coffeae]MBY8863824.1 copper chaperone PCu(A)C [Nocardia coffeae]